MALFSSSRVIKILQTQTYLTRQTFVPFTHGQARTSTTDKVHANTFKLAATVNILS